MLRLLKTLEKYDHVIWDWNGTLLNDVNHAVETINVLLSKRQLPLLNVDTYRKNFCFPIRKYYDFLGFQYQQETFEAVCDEFVDVFMAKVFACPLIPGAKDLLRTIKERGQMQSVLSATDQENLDRMMSHFDLRPHLDHIFGIENKFAASKIHRGHELLALSKTDPARTVLVGDTDHDLEVGQALGIPVILLSHGHQCVNKLRGIHPNVVNVAELSPDL